MENQGSSRKKCSNTYCVESSISSWKEGWILRSGNRADLCNRCSDLYECGRFCLRYHSGQKGWTCCNLCRKRIHSGCIASLGSFLFLDEGGVQCISCSTESVKDGVNSVECQTKFQTKSPLLAPVVRSTGKVRLLDLNKSPDEDEDEEDTEDATTDSERNTLGLGLREGMALLQARGKPSIVMVGGFEFEEYDELPVLEMVRREERPQSERGEMGNVAEKDKGKTSMNVLATTKHPRHPVGCRCVVCVQHPSGKPHRPGCTCPGCDIYGKRRATITQLNKHKKRSSQKKRKRRLSRKDVDSDSDSDV